MSDLNEISEPEDNRPSRLQQVKHHLTANKKTYLVGVGCFAAGGLVFRGGPEVKSIIDSKNFKWHSPTNNITQIVLPPKGDPGNVVQNIRTKEIWPSQGELARTKGIDASVVSRYFNGKKPDIDGDQYVKLGKAGHELL